MKHVLLSSSLLFILLSSCSNNTPDEQSATSNPDSLDGKSAYTNPVDNKTYQTDGQFQTYTPDGGVQPQEGPVKLLNVILLTDQQVIGRAMGVDGLANFIKGAQAIVKTQLDSVPEHGQIILQFTLYPKTKPVLGLSVKGNLTDNELNGVYDNVEKYSKDIRTQNDTCVFQCVFGVNEK